MCPRRVGTRPWRSGLGRKNGKAGEGQQAIGVSSVDTPPSFFSKGILSGAGDMMIRGWSFDGQRVTTARVSHAFAESASKQRHEKGYRMGYLTDWFSRHLVQDQRRLTRRFQVTSKIAAKGDGHGGDRAVDWSHWSIRGRKNWMQTRTAYSRLASLMLGRML